MSDRRALRGYAETSADAKDPRLRGRTYAIPFEDVWQAARRIAGSSRWTIISEDDQEGVITAFADARIGQGHDIEVRIGLDMDAQTRVDAVAAARKPSTDLGGSARQLARLFRALDRALAGAAPRRIAQRRT